MITLFKHASGSETILNTADVIYAGYENKSILLSFNNGAELELVGISFEQWTAFKSNLNIDIKI